MVRTLLALAPALLALALGAYASAAGTDADYLDRLRVLFLGAVGLAWISALVYVWRKKEGLLRRLALSALTLIALRVLYVPALDLALVGATWVERLGANAGLADRGFLAHAALGLLASLIAGPLCMLLVEGVTRPLRWFTTVALALLVLLAVAMFLSPEDRAPLPQRLGAIERPASGPPERDEPGAFARRAERLGARVVGLGELALRYLMPREGWGGALRAELEAAPQGDSVADVWANVESAFVEARPALED